MHLSRTTSGGFRAALFLVAAACPLRAENRLSVGHGEGLAGAGRVPVAVTCLHDEPIHGFSLSLSYPQNALRLLGITAQGTASAAAGVDFFQEVLDDASGTAVLGAIFAFSEPYQLAELPATGPGDLPQLLAWLVFDVRPGAPPGEHAIRLVDGLGDPPISNRFTHRGTTIRPLLEEGGFVVQSENVLTLESKFAFPGFRIGALHAYARHPQPLEGFQLAVSFDPRALQLTEATVSGTVMLTQVGGFSSIEFLRIKWSPQEIAISPTESRTTAGVVFDYLEPLNPRQVLPAETGSTTRQSIMKYGFQVKEGAELLGESVTLSLEDSAHPDTLNNVFIIDRLGVVPRKVNGRVYFSTGYLSGKVVDFETRRPISGAALAAEPGDHSATSRADGAFVIGGEEGIPPGPYSVAVTRNGYYPGRARGEVSGKNATSDLGTIFLFPIPPDTGGFRRGMINADGGLDISDGIALLGFLFLGDAPLACRDSGDVNDDGVLDLSDAITLFSHLFTGGKAPPPPFVSCGDDTSADTLDCLAFPGC